ncbi:MAG: hypothetical protein KF858_00580 [Candidatus Sumerlaeia bacterium]|nr:hypothetical protein [Candidatus Sumerlaeia bacterium]
MSPLRARAYSGLAVFLVFWPFSILAQSAFDTARSYFVFSVLGLPTMNNTAYLYNREIIEYTWMPGQLGLTLLAIVLLSKFDGLGSGVDGIPERLACLGRGYGAAVTGCVLLILGSQLMQMLVHSVAGWSLDLHPFQVPFLIAEAVCVATIAALCFRLIRRFAVVGTFFVVQGLLAAGAASIHLTDLGREERQGLESMHVTAYATFLSAVAAVLCFLALLTIGKRICRPGGHSLD